MPKIKYECNQQLGLCTFIQEVEQKGYRRYAIFECQCGSQFTADIQKVKTMHTKSCGCRIKEILQERNIQLSVDNIKHGLSKSKIMDAYTAMKQRCCNTNHPEYVNYGGRGIVVCEEWLNSFSNFFSDMGESYKEGLSIDRYDVNGNYHKENCWWASSSWQTYNQTMRCTNTSGKTGVHQNKKDGLWEATICKEYVVHRLGRFTTFEEAVAAREAAEIKYFGRLKGN